MDVLRRIQRAEHDATAYDDAYVMGAVLVTSYAEVLIEVGGPAFGVTMQKKLPSGSLKHSAKGCMLYINGDHMTTNISKRTGIQHRDTIRTGGMHGEPYILIRSGILTQTGRLRGEPHRING